METGSEKDGRRGETKAERERESDVFPFASPKVEG